MSLLPAASSGLTSVISMPASASAGARAPAASPMVRKEKGPARSKKPGCSIKTYSDGRCGISNGASAKGSKASEVGRGAEAENLRLVELGFEQSVGDVGAERSQGDCQMMLKPVDRRMPWSSRI